MANLFRCGGGRTEASYQNLMDQLIEETATGPIASFTDGANNIPTKEIICHINPTETGTGEKSPSNPYVIGGFTECNITHQSTIPVTNNAPYLFRQSGGDNNADVYNQEKDKLVGASAVVNQIVQNGNFASTDNWSAYRFALSVSNNIGTVTVNYADAYGSIYQRAVTTLSTHIYLWVFTATCSKSITLRIGNGANRYAAAQINANTRTTAGRVFKPSGDGTNIYFYLDSNGNLSVGDTITCENFMLIDLTQMFGTAIADYVYSLEHATAGSGIAYLRKYGFFTKDYIPYTANTLQSVNTSKHTMVGKNLALVSQNTEARKNGANLFTLNYENNSITMETSSAGSLWVIWRFFQVSQDFVGKTVNISYNTQLSGFPVVLVRADNPQFLAPVTDLTRNYTTYTFVSSDVGKYIGIRFMNTSGQSTTINNVQLEFGSTATEYEPYTKHEYALPNIDLRGLYKLDASNNLYADGDTLTGDGTLTRKYEQRPYQSGDESLADAITDGTNTVVKLATPTTEQVTGFTNPQIVDKYGTEEYTDARDFPLPVGHETIYLPTGQREYTVPFGQTVYGGELVLHEGQNDKLIPWKYIASYNGEAINEPWVSSMDAYAPGTTPTTGAFVCYPAATPAEITLPTKTEIKTLLGSNNFYHGCNGDIDVTYRANGALYVQEHPITRGLMAARPTEQIQEQEEQQEEKEINKSEDNER